MAQDGPNMAPDGPKMAPRRAKMAYDGQDGPKMAKYVLHSFGHLGDMFSSFEARNLKTRFPFQC